MSALPPVSVVIPVFDRPAALEVVLRFFEYQTYPKQLYEVIVVDDGSVDQLGRRLQPSAYDYRLLVSVQPNRGRAAARNRGVELAGGELILFCDADRIPDTDWIEAHASVHRRIPSCAAVGVPWDCFYGARRLELADRSCLPRIRRYSRQPVYFAATAALFDDGAPRSPIAWASFLIGNASIRRDVLVQCGGLDPELTSWGMEHFELGVRLAGQDIAIRRHDAASYHIPHPRSTETYRAGIERCVLSLAGKKTGRAMALLRDFLFGEISLQELERRYVNTSTGALDSHPAIYYRQLGPP